jgi:ABC-type transport system involved in cytochrome c biogenesis permease subunit
MHDMSIFWLRAAAGLYSVGLLHAILTALRRSAPLFRPALATFTLGAVLHFVALVEMAFVVRHLPVDNFYESASVCAFLIALVFLFVHWRYQFSSLSVFLFPLVFLLTLVGAMEIPVAGWANPRLRDAWLLVHVLLILIGYASLLLTAVASVFYLVQERHLKRKQPRAFFDRLPPLGTLDNLITRSMGMAFAFITLGVIAASTWAFIESGTRWIGEAKIAIAFLTWGVCLVMVFLRTTAGWRGRKAALLSVFALGLGATTWVAHIGLRSLLKRRNCW